MSVPCPWTGGAGCLRQASHNTIHNTLALFPCSLSQGLQIFSLLRVQAEQLSSAKVFAEGQQHRLALLPTVSDYFQVFSLRSLYLRNEAKAFALAKRKKSLMPTLFEPLLPSSAIVCVVVCYYFVTTSPRKPCHFLTLIYLYAKGIHNHFIVIKGFPLPLGWGEHFWHSASELAGCICIH